MAHRCSVSITGQNNVSVVDPTRHSVTHVMMTLYEHKAQCYCRHMPTVAFLEFFYGVYRKASAYFLVVSLTQPKIAAI